MFEASKKREWLVRWQEEETFLNFNSSFLFSMKENNPQTNERNIYKEKLDILN